MKSILKPSKSKSIIALILLILTSWLWRVIVPIFLSDTFPYGFPLPFYDSGGPCRPQDDCSSFNLWWFFIDLIFWYVITGMLLRRRGTPME